MAEYYVGEIIFVKVNNDVRTYTVRQIEIINDQLHLYVSPTDSPNEISLLIYNNDQWWVQGTEPPLTVQVSSSPGISLDTLTDLLHDPELALVGRGGFGEIFTHPDYRKYAIKISKKENVCLEWQQEFNIQQDIAQLYNTQYPNTLVHVVVPYNFYEYDKRCYMIMERVCPVKKDPSDIKQLKGKSTHALVGQIKGVRVLPQQRGISIGRDIIRKYVDLDRVSYDLGQFLGFLHYALKYDGLDLEYIIGPICGSTQIKINVLDFGLVKKLSDNVEDIVSKAVDVILTLPYFPTGTICKYEDCTPEEQEEETRLGNAFWLGYFDMAAAHDKIDIAKRIQTEVLKF